MKRTDVPYVHGGSGASSGQRTCTRRMRRSVIAACAISSRNGRIAMSGSDATGASVRRAGHTTPAGAALRQRTKRSGGATAPEEPELGVHRAHRFLDGGNGASEPVRGTFGRDEVLKRDVRVEGALGSPRDSLEEGR